MKSKTLNIIVIIGILILLISNESSCTKKMRDTSGIYEYKKIGGKTYRKFVGEDDSMYILIDSLKKD